MKKIIIFVFLILVCGGLFWGLGRFASRDGSGDGISIFNSLKEEKKDKKSPNKQVIIKVEENNIYIDDEECSSIDDLTDKISKISSKGQDTRFIEDFSEVPLSR